MRRRVTRWSAALLCVACIGAPTALAEEHSVKQEMAQNLEAAQRILLALIHSNYEGVAEDAEMIRQHAVHVGQNRPEAAEKAPHRFASYAYELEANAESLKSIAETLAERDRASAAEGGGIDTDYLREAAGAHYGGMVTMCVACHNVFRGPMGR